MPDSKLEFPRIRDLRIVQAVFRQGRVSIAADIIHISQPAATQSLLRVEKRLGATLFERRPEGMITTEVGELFRRRLARILELIRRGDSLARERTARTDSRGKPFYVHCSPVQLRALLAISDAGSFSQAARDLGVKQPGVHRAARELSALAGFRLFEQTRQGVILTAAAAIFAHQVKLAMNEFRQSCFEINEFLGRDMTRINIGSMPLSRTANLPAATARLISEVGAAVQVNCVEARYGALLRDLRFGDLDFLFGALRYPKPAGDIEQEELFTDHLVVVASPSHPLTRSEAVTLRDTLDYPWIAPPRNTPSGAYLFETLGIGELKDTPVRIVSSSLVFLRSLLSHGTFVSIASARQVEADEKTGAVIRLPIELPDSERAIGLTFRSRWSPTPLQNRLLDIIRQVAVDPTS
ncbi:MAG: LysR family transcriptional regulator [Rhodobacteraceae bacterium]|nr:LysR family transcriptional regulator [Paracoccaceae bacterium]